MKPYLIFSLQNIKYAIDPIVVKQIFLLPELMPLAETPDDIVGILNIKGEIVPAMHLALRLGNDSMECGLDNNIVVLEEDNVKIGMIVDRVYDVKIIEPNQIQTQVNLQQIRQDNQSSSSMQSAFISGIAQVDEAMIVLLNSQALIREPDQVKNAVEQQIEEQTDIISTESFKSNIDKAFKQSNLDFYQICCPNATPEEKAIFRQRAEELAISTIGDEQNTNEQIPIAIVNLQGEYFGMDLSLVREFTKVSSFSPIPCCPEHIIGNMNLRGEILTLVDIRPSLNMESNIVK